MRWALPSINEEPHGERSCGPWPPRGRGSSNALVFISLRGKVVEGPPWSPLGVREGLSACSAFPALMNCQHADWCNCCFV